MSTERGQFLDPRLQSAIVEYLNGRRRQGASLLELAGEMEPRWSEPQVSKCLQELSRVGDAIEWNRRWYSPRFIDFAIGTVRQLERGDALILAGLAAEPSYFVRRRNLKGAISGDLVLLRKSGKQRQRAGTSGRLPEAVVARVLNRRWSRLVGQVERRDRSWWLVPFDSRLALDIQIPDADPACEGQFAVVELDDRDAATAGPRRAHIVEVLGSVDTPGVDVEVVLRHFGIPEEMPPEALEEAAGLPTDPDAASFEGRRDLRHETVVTIDGESARDFDDAISLEPTAAGGYRLGVHIADVSAYVAEDSALDRAAYVRGTSVYYPERAIPMLPERLSNGLCSLRPDVPRLCLSVFLDLDAAGEVVGRSMQETVICSCRRLTYEEVRQFLAGDPGAPSDLTSEVQELLRRAEGLMHKRLALRQARGSIDFDLPEGDVILDTEGFTVGVRPGQRSPAHRIIEEFMIAANEAVAAEIDGHEWPALHRIHEAPRLRDLAELREILAELGMVLEADLEALHPGVLQELLQDLENEPEETFVASLVLRAMQRARYHPESRGHYALSTRHYLHFTSPIRRYPDLLVHRQLKRLLAGATADAGDDQRLRLALPLMADHCSLTERRAEQSERVLLQWKLVRFLAGRTGERFTGRITGVQPVGLFVQLTDYFVDGLVPIRTLADDFYDFEAEHHRLVGRSTGRQLRLADEVEVVLDGVDLRRRSLNLRLAKNG